MIEETSLIFDILLFMHVWSREATGLSVSHRKASHPLGLPDLLFSALPLSFLHWCFLGCSTRANMGLET